MLQKYTFRHCQLNWEETPISYVKVHLFTVKQYFQICIFWKKKKKKKKKSIQFKEKAKNILKKIQPLIKKNTK